MKPTLIMSDGHYVNQYSTIFDQAGPVDHIFNVGDLTVLWYDKIIPDPGYQAKLDALAEGKSKEVASARQQAAWETNLEDMLNCVLTAAVATKYSMDTIQQYHELGRIPQVVDVVGNADAIVEKDINKAANILERRIDTNQDYISRTKAITQIRDEVYTEVIGSVRYICIPFNEEKSREYEKQVADLVTSDESDLSKAIILTHECPIAEEIGVKKPPVMDNLRKIAEDTAEIYKSKEVEVMLISGHIHSLPTEEKVTLGGVNYYPIGIDKTGGIRYLLVDEQGEIETRTTPVNLTAEDIVRLKEKYRKEVEIDLKSR